MIAEVLERAADPLHVVLDAHDHVREHRRALRSVDREQVREPHGLQAEQGVWSVGPRVAEQHAVASADVDAEQRAGHGVETGSEHDEVDVEVTLRGLHSGLVDRLEGGREAVVAETPLTTLFTRKDFLPDS